MNTIPNEEHAGKLEATPNRLTWTGLLSIAVVIGMILGTIAFSFMTPPKMISRLVGLNSSM